MNSDTTTTRASMLQVPPVDLFNTLRIPDVIKDLPKFDGNPRLLHEFINNVEEILTYIRCVDGTTYSTFVLRAIRNKIEGQANEVLNMYGTPVNWDEIKNNLILHYSDKRTETSLIRDLHNLRQGNKTVEEFYSSIIEIQASLQNNILIHETDQNVIKAKQILYAEMCLNVFLTGLKEPIGSVIRAMRPESLPTALSFCIKEQNIFYTKATFLQNTPYRNQQQFKHPQPRPNIPAISAYRAPLPRATYLNRNPNLNFSNNQGNFMQSLRNSPNNKLFDNTTPMMKFNQQSSPYNPQQNTFRYPQQHKPMSLQNPQKFAPPEPMDTSSSNTRLTYKTNRSNLNSTRYPNNQQRYTIEEVHNVNTDPIKPPSGTYQQSLDHYYNDNHELNNPQQ